VSGPDLKERPPPENVVAKHNPAAEEVIRRSH
jgi:hypothetical protein